MVRTSSLIGRAPVSKTGGWGFESLLVRHPSGIVADLNEMLERARELAPNDPRWIDWLAAMGEELETGNNLVVVPMTLLRCEAILRAIDPDDSLNGSVEASMWRRAFILLERQPFPEDYVPESMSWDEVYHWKEWERGESYLHSATLRETTAYQYIMWCDVLSTLQSGSYSDDIVDRLATERDEQVKRGAVRVADIYERARLAVLASKGKKMIVDTFSSRLDSERRDEIADLRTSAEHLISLMEGGLTELQETYAKILSLIQKEHRDHVRDVYQQGKKAGRAEALKETT